MIGAQPRIQSVVFTLLMWRRNIPALGFNIMPCDGLALNVARASTGMAMAEKNRNVLLFPSWFRLLSPSQIQDTIKSGNVSFVIIKNNSAW